MIQAKRGRQGGTWLHPKLAEYFGKAHGKVLRAIETIGCSVGFNQANFGLIRWMKCSAGFRLRNFVETVIWRDNPSGGEPIIKALEGAGAIAKRDSDRKRHTKKYRVPGGGSPGLYVIDPETMDGEGGSV